MFDPPNWARILLLLIWRHSRNPVPNITKLHLGIFNVYTRRRIWICKKTSTADWWTPYCNVLDVGRCWGSRFSCRPMSFSLWFSPLLSRREVLRFSNDLQGVVRKSWCQPHQFTSYLRIIYIMVCWSWSLKQLHPFIREVGKEKCQQLKYFGQCILHDWIPNGLTSVPQKTCWNFTAWLCWFVLGAASGAQLGYLRIIKATVSRRKTAWDCYVLHMCKSYPERDPSTMHIWGWIVNGLHDPKFMPVVMCDCKPLILVIKPLHACGKSSFLLGNLANFLWPWLQ